MIETKSAHDRGMCGGPRACCLQCMAREDRDMERQQREMAEAQAVLRRGHLTLLRGGKMTTEECDHLAEVPR